jgi:hypothetical protein
MRRYVLKAASRTGQDVSRAHLDARACLQALRERRQLRRFTFVYEHVYIAFQRGQSDGSLKGTLFFNMFDI